MKVSRCLNQIAQQVICTHLNLTHLFRNSQETTGFPLPLSNVEHEDINANGYRLIVKRHFITYSIEKGERGMVLKVEIAV